MTNQRPGAVGRPFYVLSDLADEELLDRLRILLVDDGQVTAQVVAHIGEVDSRRLYARAACPSMFAYCVDLLHLSESAAYKRIHAARAGRRFPIIFEMLAARRLHLTAVKLLAPLLTPENHLELLGAAAGRSKRQIEELIAARFPVPDLPARIRRCPGRPEVARGPTTAAPGTAGATPVTPAGQLGLVPAAAAGAAASPPAPVAATVTATTATPAAAPSGLVAPLSAETYKVQFTVSREQRALIQEAQDLLGRAVPSGDLAGLFERALRALVQDLRRKKFAEVERPRAKVASGGAGAAVRRVPAAVRRAVAVRDGGRCTFVDERTGRRCPERAGLQFHHLEPFARGGLTVPSNLTLRCANHNLLDAEDQLGRATVRSRMAAARTQLELTARPG